VLCTGRHIKKNLDDSHRLCNSDNLYSDNFGNLTSRASL